MGSREAALVSRLPVPSPGSIPSPHWHGVCLGLLEPGVQEPGPRRPALPRGRDQQGLGTAPARDPVGSGQGRRCPSRDPGLRPAPPPPQILEAGPRTEPPCLLASWFMEWALPGKRQLPGEGRSWPLGGLCRSQFSGALTDRAEGPALPKPAQTLRCHVLGCSGTRAGNLPVTRESGGWHSGSVTRPSSCPAQPPAHRGLGQVV